MNMRTLLAVLVCAMLTVTGVVGRVAKAEAPDSVGQWSAGAMLPYFPVHIHMLPTGKVMLWPGDGISGNDPRAWDPTTDVITPLSTPGYDTFCSGHTFLTDGSLFVTGGHIQNFEGLPRTSRFNPFTNSWALLPDMNAGRWYPTNTVLANGDVLTLSGSIDTVLGNNPLPQVPANDQYLAQPDQRPAYPRYLPTGISCPEWQDIQCCAFRCDPLSGYDGYGDLELCRESQ
jgi:hypothetical protein